MPGKANLLRVSSRVLQRNGSFVHTCSDGVETMYSDKNLADHATVASVDDRTMGILDQTERIRDEYKGYGATVHRSSTSRRASRRIRNLLIQLI